MQDRPTHTASEFDLDTWHEELLALNPWARGLTIDQDNEEFAAARQKATLARHAEGKDAWNAWSNGMLALKSALEVGGQWGVSPESAWGYLKGDNEATRLWLAPALTVFSNDSSGHRFEADVDFDGFVFPSHARFNYATFTSRASFVRATFVGVAEFVNTTFRGAVSFRSVTFRDRAAFWQATFGDFTLFDDTSFSGDTDFNRANFIGVATFRRAMFSRVILFADAMFGGTAQFQDATFSGAARFGDATFSKEAQFTGATFGGQARFVGAAFCGRALLKRVRFQATPNFRQAKFETGATFEGSVFDEGAKFEGIDSTSAFLLDGATFQQVPSLFGATFKGVLRLDNIKTPRYGILGYTPDKDARARFRELRRRAVEAQDRDRELEFFAQEIRTGRFHAEGWPSWSPTVLQSRLPKALPPWVPKVWSWRFWFGLAYGTFSNFGRSLWRPLLTWATLTVLFAAFFLGEHEDMRKARADLGSHWSTLGAYAVTTLGAWNNPPACRVFWWGPFDSTDAVTEAIQLSLKNALVFNVGGSESVRRTYSCLYGLDAGDQLRVSVRVSTASMLQSLASGVLIFLFLLAVRNLLRLK